MEAKKLHPYIKARCGERNHEHFSKTNPAKTTSKYSGTVEWTVSHKNRLEVQRHPRDEGILVVEVWNWDRRHHHQFIGGVQRPRPASVLVGLPVTRRAAVLYSPLPLPAGTHVDLHKYMSNPDVTTDEKLQMFNGGRPGPEAFCVGYVRSRRTEIRLVAYPAKPFSNAWVARCVLR